MPKSRQAKILIIAIIIYIAIFCFVTLKKYYNFGYNAFDLAIFNQVFFNTLHGQWFYGTVNVNTYLADHFSPMIFLLLPFYSLRQTPESLLVLQSIISALCAWPLYLIAKELTKNLNLALGASLLWLVNPFVHNANLMEWHILTVAAFFIFWTFYFYLKNNFKLYILFFILSLLAREDIFLIMLGFGVLSFLDKKSRFWKLFSIILSVIYFLAAIKIISHYSLTGDYKFFVYYGWLGGRDLPTILWSWITHPSAVFLHVFSLKNIFGILVILLPLLCLPFIRPKYGLLSIFPLLQLMLTASGVNFVVYKGYYAMLILPGIFLSLIFSLDKIQKHLKIRKIIYLMLVIASIYFIIFLSPIKNSLFFNYDIKTVNFKRDFISHVPPEATLAVESSLQPALSSRQTIYATESAYAGYSQFGVRNFKLPLVNFLVIDYHSFIGNLVDVQQNTVWQYKYQTMPANWRQVLQDYALVKAENNLYLYQNKNQLDFPELKFYEIKIKPTDFNNPDFLVSQNWENNILKLTFQKKIDPDKNYLVRFYKADSYFDVPLDYGIYPVREWSEDKLYSFYYYPDNQVNSFEIFSWTGENRFGPIKNVIVDLKLYKI